MNYKPGMVFNSSTQSLHVDHMNVPVNPGTPACGTAKTNYKRRKVRTHTSNAKTMRFCNMCTQLCAPATCAAWHMHARCIEHHTKEVSPKVMTATAIMRTADTCNSLYTRISQLT